MPRRVEAVHAKAWASGHGFARRVVINAWSSVYEKGECAEGDGIVIGSRNRPHYCRGHE